MRFLFLVKLCVGLEDYLTLPYLIYDRDCLPFENLLQIVELTYQQWNRPLGIHRNFADVENQKVIWRSLD